VYAFRFVSAHGTIPLHLISLHKHVGYNSNYEDH